MCGASIPAGLHSFAIVDKKYGVFFNRSIFDNVGSMMYVDMSVRAQRMCRVPCETRSSKGGIMTKVGIREVAKASGVSVSTVSRAFTRPDLVSDKTRRKVLETADRLDFNISRSATALKSGLTYRAAMLMNEDITSWFNNRALAGLDDVMHGAGYDISLFQHIDTAENRERFFTTLPVRRNVDAVFVASFAVDSREVE